MGSRVEISKRIVAINSVGTIVRAVLSLSVLFWMHQHLIRRIDKEEYILLPILMAVMAFTPLLSTVLVGGLARFATEAHAKGDERRVTEITSSMAPLLILVSLALIGFGLLFCWQIDVALKIAPEQVATAQQMFMLLIGTAALRVSASPFVMGYAIQQKFVQRDLIGFGAELLRLGLLVYLLTQHGATVLWVPVATFVSNVAELAVLFVGSRRLMPSLRFDRSAMRRDVIAPIASFGGWTVLGKVSRLIREMADPLILNRFASSADVVAFNLGSQVDRQFRRTLFGVTAVAQPAATAMAATDQMDRLRNTWFRLSRYTLTVMMAVAIPLIVFREEFFSLWLREQFESNRDAAMVMMLLLARFVAIFPNAATGLVTTARAEVRVSSLQSAALELANLAATLLLVGALHMGAVGSAVATLAVATVGHPLLLWRLGLSVTGARFGPWFRTSIVPGLLPGIVALPMWLTVQHTVQPDTWLSLSGCWLGGWAVYALVTFLTMHPDDRRDLRQVLASRGVKNE